MAIELRAATEKDVPRLIDLGKAFAQEQNTYWTFNKLGPGWEKFVAEAMRTAVEHPAARVIVAEEEGRMAGYVLGQIAEPPPLFEVKPYLFVSDLYVRPEYRRQGIATRLVETLRVWALTQGVWRLSLVIAEQNPAHGLWQRLGFEPMERLLFWADPEYGR